MKFKILQVKNTYQHVSILHFILLRLGQDQWFIARHGIRFPREDVCSENFSSLTLMEHSNLSCFQDLDFCVSLY